MSAFHRIVTYLHLYDNHIKGRNIGFAKIAKKGNTCLIEIHMKNTGHSLPSIPVYFYVQKDQALHGIPLGSMSLVRGNGDFKAVLDKDGFYGYALEDVKGIFIPISEETMLVSQWDNDAFARERFVPLSPAGDHSQIASEKHTPPDYPHNLEAASPKAEMPPHATSAEIDSADSSTFRKTSLPDVATEQENDSPASESDAAIEQTNPAPPTEQTDSPAPVSSAKEETNSLEATEALPKQNRSLYRNPFALPRFTPLWQQQAIQRQRPKNKSASAPTGDSCAAQSPAKDSQKHAAAKAPEPPSEDWPTKWQFLLENYPVMTPFAGDENTLCIRLDLKDIRLLPKKYWYLGNNSFLLHGFFNYRYLILGMTEKSDCKKWFLGIPGIFQNPERVMATLFGFPGFRSEKSSPINTGEFGYWFRYLDE